MAASLPLTIEPARASTPLPSVLTIGVFDGVHLGHRQLIGGAVERARALSTRSVALTFDPHPRAVLGNPASVSYLSDLDERKALIRLLGVDALAVLHFSREVAAVSAEEFVLILRDRLGMAELWIGPDFALGRNREGTVPALRSLGARHGFAVHTVSHVVLDQTVVSSSAIRARLSAGEVEEAASLLGRPYSLGGVVSVGERRGRQLGYPTANLAISPQRARPADGVYVVEATVGEAVLPAVASIGVRPTFGASERNLEAHILDFAGDLYGERMGVAFLRRLRPELRFAGPSDLVRQMDLDVAAARAYFVERERLTTSRGERS